MKHIAIITAILFSVSAMALDTKLSGQVSTPVVDIEVSAAASARRGQRPMIMPVVRVYDGDTMFTNLAQLPAPLNAVSIRLYGIDTPELGWRADCEEEAALAIKAKQFVVDLIGDNKMVSVTNYKWDKFGGRIDGIVFVDGKDIGQELIKVDLARPYMGRGQKPTWCPED